jgi:hypothetical protein
MHWVLAALLVLVGGVAIAFSETVKLKVENRDGERVEIDLNGDVQLIELENLADGETRDFTAGDHNVQVRRVGDELQVMLDGDAFIGEKEGGFAGNMVWVTDDGETVHMPGAAKRVIVMKDPDSVDGENKTYAVRIKTDEDCEDCEELVDIDVARIDEFIEIGDLS